MVFLGVEMEPVTAGAIALASLFGTEALKTAGGMAGEAIARQGEKAWQLLRRQAPQVAGEIEQASPESEEVLVADVVRAAQGDAELADALRELAAAVQANPQVAQGKLAEKIGIVVQGGTVEIREFRMD